MNKKQSSHFPFIAGLIPFFMFCIAIAFSSQDSIKKNWAAECVGKISKERKDESLKNIKKICDSIHIH